MPWNATATLTRATECGNHAPPNPSSSRTIAKPCKIITLHVHIDGVQPPIWRRIVVDGDMTLRLLHHIFQAAFGWTDSHLHEFAIEDTKY